MTRLNFSLIVLLVVARAVSLLAGRVWLPPSSLHEVFSQTDTLALLIVTQIRLPRTVLALMVGAVLACGLTFALGHNGTVALVLAGAAVSSLTAAGIALALNFAPNPYAAYEIMSWLLGSLADKSWTQVLLVLPFALLGGGLLALTGRALDALSLGETQAQSLGINLARLAAVVVAGTALSVGAVTSVVGAIGFIGLVAPHIVRPLVGHAPRRVLFPAALAGALLLLSADIAARLVHTNPELKLGVFTSLLGTPFFFWLVIRIRKVAP